ncbi:MAG: hypothetical protein KDB33_04465 [Acidimicrobiales bacterium]|nr:hypothetical protein [Acidimicrobiales bacterium]MCB1259634.1 hypothetical protein [Acidimicrobiales bacterium]
MEIRKGGPIALVVGVAALVAGLLLPVVLTSATGPQVIAPDGDTVEVTGDTVGAWTVLFRGPAVVGPDDATITVTPVGSGSPGVVTVPIVRSSEATSEGPATRMASVAVAEPGVYRITVAASGTAASSGGTWLVVAPDVPLPGVVVLRWLLLVAGAGLIVAWLVQRNEVRTRQAAREARARR